MQIAFFLSLVSPSLVAKVKVKAGLSLSLSGEERRLLRSNKLPPPPLCFFSLVKARARAKKRTWFRSPVSSSGLGLLSRSWSAKADTDVTVVVAVVLLK